MPAIGHRSFLHSAERRGPGSSEPAGAPAPGKRSLVSELEDMPPPARGSMAGKPATGTGRAGAAGAGTAPAVAGSSPSVAVAGEATAVSWETWDVESQTWRDEAAQSPAPGRDAADRGSAIAARVMGAAYTVDGRFQVRTAAGDDIDIRIARVITPVPRMRRHPGGDGVLLEIPLDFGDDEFDDEVIARLTAVRESAEP